VVLEDRSLEVLHGIWLAVQVADFGELIGYGVALLYEAAVLTPISKESAAKPFARFGEKRRSAC
jgi:hypothetical protein